MQTKTRFLFLLFIALFLVSCKNFPIGKLVISSDIEKAIEQAFQKQAQENADQEIVFLLYETRIDYIEFNDDQTQALVWFALLDEETGEPNGTEPGLVLAELTNDDPEDPDSWSMTFQHQSAWTDVVWQTDTGLLDIEEKQTLSAKAQVAPHAGQIYTGYKLPWQEGTRTKLSGSIAHVFIYKTCPDTCLYAFDFWTGDMFPVHAAKGGVVKIAKWDVENGDTAATNYLLVEDNSTEPTTYAIYYHLAHDSIPEELRIAGAEVYQGQLIGNADDTGASTAHHLHFMVHTNPYSYWGSSVDIVFDEVDINGGRPRTCNEADLYPEYGNECHEDGDWFYSENADNRPPSAWISSPNANTTIESRSFTAMGEAEDDVAIKTISMFLRQGDAGWGEVGESQNQNTLTTEIDICDLNLQDGSFELALEVVDVDGKITRTFDTPHTLIKDFDCTSTPPACIPSPLEIALYTEPNYQGSCTLLNTGSYYGMVYVPNIDNDEVSSILVGSTAYAFLYQDNNLKGNYEVFTQDDPDLQDNTIGNDTVSSLSVYEIPGSTQKPILPEDVIAYEGELISIDWQGNLDEYTAELLKNDETIEFQDWSSETSYTPGYLEEGEYTLIVTGRNIIGEAKSSMQITILKADAIQPITEMSKLPTTSTNSTIQLEWTVTAGKQNIDHFEIQYRIADGNWENLHTNIDAGESTAYAILDADNTYEFRMRAIAIDGPSEEFPASAETRITINEICMVDLYEDDDLQQNATLLEEDKTQLHLFCPENDTDWIKVEVNSTHALTLLVDPMDNKLPITAEIYAPDDTLNQTVSIFENNSLITITPQDHQLGMWNILLKPYDPMIFGQDTAYQVEIQHSIFKNKISFSVIFLGLTGLILLLFRRLKN